MDEVTDDSSMVVDLVRFPISESYSLLMSVFDVSDAGKSDLFVVSISSDISIESLTSALGLQVAVVVSAELKGLNS